MADNTQGLPVISKAGEFLLSKLVDTAGTNVASISAANALKVDGSAVTQPVSDGGGSLTVDGTVSISGAVDTELPAAAALTDNFANPTAPGVGAFGMAWDGATWDRMKGDSTDGLLVNLGANNDVTFSGSVDTELSAAAALADATANPTVTSVGSFGQLFNGTTWDRVRSGGVTGMAGVTGATAADAAIAANPVTVGGRASAAAPTDMSADGDVVNAWHLRNGATATVLTAAGALIGGDATNGLDVDVTRMSALVASSANIGDVDVLTVPAPLSTTGNGTAATALRVSIASDTTGVVAVTDNGGSLTVDGTVAATQSGTWTSVGPTASDAPLTASPLTVGGRTSAAAPTDMSADGDVVNAWHLRNGAQATVITAAGALIGGDAANGLDVDVTRVTGTVTVDSELPAAASLTDNFANPTAPGVGAFNMLWDSATWDRAPGTSTDGALVNLGANNDVTVTSGAITADTELPAAAALADATANPTVPGVGAFNMGYNGATWDRIRTANTGRLQVDVITGGSGSGLVSPQFDYATSGSLGAGASVDIDFDDIAGTTGDLAGLDVWSAAPLKVEIKTVTGGTPTTRSVIGATPGVMVHWRAPHQSYITQTAGAGNFFRARVTNLGSQASDVHATAYWDEV